MKTKMLDLKKYEITQQKSQIIKGGGLIRVIIDCSNQCNVEYAGLSMGMYIKDTETGEMWNILGSQVR